VVSDKLNILQEAIEATYNSSTLKRIFGVAREIGMIIKSEEVILNKKIF
jgi:hypothetical protein